MIMLYRRHVLCNLDSNQLNHSKEALMSAFKPHERQAKYRVDVLPQPSDYDNDWGAYFQDFPNMMAGWEEQGYELIAVASYEGKLLGFFKKRNPD